MVPVLRALLGAFPFRVRAFHADNGSEYINHRVAAMLNKLHIKEFTKSRPRRSNDNALVESKNGNIVRWWLGHSHIPERLAPQANAFLRDLLSPFLNHHRACLFAVEIEGPNGRRRRKYPQELVETPYETLKSLPGAEDFLKPGVTFEQLDAVANAVTDLEAACEVQRARKGVLPTRRPGDDFSGVTAGGRVLRERIASARSPWSGSGQADAPTTVSTMPSGASAPLGPATGKRFARRRTEVQCRPHLRWRGRSGSA